MYENCNRQKHTIRFWGLGSVVLPHFEFCRTVMFRSRDSVVTLHEYKTRTMGSVLLHLPDTNLIQVFHRLLFGPHKLRNIKMSTQLAVLELHQIVTLVPDDLTYGWWHLNQIKSKCVGPSAGVPWDKSRNRNCGATLPRSYLNFIK